MQEKRIQLLTFADLSYHRTNPCYHDVANFVESARNFEEASDIAVSETLRK
jgi:hypothetical protein